MKNTLIRMAPALRPAMLVGALLLTATLVAPEPVEAQASCLDCMVTGTKRFGDGQPGGELDCVDQPDGMTECLLGIHWGGPWCETSGSMCQALMFLDFSEDGSAHERPEVDPVQGPYAILGEEARRTCDGVLLHTPGFNAAREERRDVAAALLL